MYVVGDNCAGQLGLGDFEPRTVFTVIPSLKGIGVEYVHAGSLAIVIIVVVVVVDVAALDILVWMLLLLFLLLLLLCEDFICVVLFMSHVCSYSARRHQHVLRCNPRT